jgi:hypothetical protein
MKRVPGNSVRVVVAVAVATVVVAAEAAVAAVEATAAEVAAAAVVDTAVAVAAAVATAATRSTPQGMAEALIRAELPGLPQLFLGVDEFAHDHGIDDPFAQALVDDLHRQ